MINTGAKVIRPQLWHLAALLDYPTEDFASRASDLCKQISAASSSQAVAALDQFILEIERIPIDELEELHTRTFSLSPVCAPYVGLQVFGENNYKRGDFIACLARDLATHGLDVHPELPDHVGSVLRLAACQSAEDFEEMLTWCFCAAVQQMAETLSSTPTPYRHLFTAISLILNDFKVSVATNV